MKIKRLFIYILLPLLFLSIVPTFVKAAPADNPVFATIENVRRMIDDAVTPIHETLSNLTSRLDTDEEDIVDLQNRVTELENIINATPTPAPSPLPEINQLMDFNQPFDVPAGYNTMIIEIQEPISFLWAPLPSFDKGTSYVEQQRFDSGISNATIPVVSSKYMVGSAVVTSVKLRLILRSDLDANAIILANNANYPFISTELNTEGYTQMIVTAGGGNNPQHLDAIVLLIKQGDNFTEAARSNCDGGAQCPATSFRLAGSSHKISIEGTGTGALFAALIRKH